MSIANVNLATEQATVSFDPHRCDENDLSKAVEKVGYQAEFLAAEASEDTINKDKQRELKDLKTKVKREFVFGRFNFCGAVFPDLWKPRRPF